MNKFLKSYQAQITEKIEYKNLKVMSLVYTNKTTFFDESR